MYVPEPFVLTDEAYTREVIEQYGFAQLVTAPDGALQASHLPFLFEPERGEKGTLTAHMAHANPQWRDLQQLGDTGGEALVIFQGPHAYVSPSWYGSGPAVPTWNYVALHAYGTPFLIEDTARKRALMDRLVATHESGLPAPWSMAGQEEAYIAAMMRAIVAFEIPLNRIEAKAKLSQNKSPEDRQSVVAGLRRSGDPLAAELAALMEGSLAQG